MPDPAFYALARELAEALNDTLEAAVGAIPDHQRRHWFKAATRAIERFEEEQAKV